MAIRWTTAFWDFPAETFEAGVEFWLAITDANLSPFRGPGREFATLIPAEGDSWLRVQRLDSGEARNHLDFHVDDIPAETARATTLGATVVSDEEGFAVLDSPGGFGFCIVAHHGEARPPRPVEWPAGQSSIVDQICIDIPPADYDREAGFWEAFTGRPRRPNVSPEYERLERPEGLPMELLVQRLDEAEPDRPTKAHIDLACSDVEAETERHLEFGAERLGRFPGWQVLRDPAGLEYCITARVPA